MNDYLKWFFFLNPKCIVLKNIKMLWLSITNLGPALWCSKVIQTPEISVFYISISSRQLLHFQSSSLLMCLGTALGANTWVPANHKGDTKLPDFWLCSSPALVVLAIWGVNRRWKVLHSVSSSVSFPFKY